MTGTILHSLLNTTCGDSLTEENRVLMIKDTLAPSPTGANT